MGAKELREQALAKLLEAKALTDAEGNVDAEHQDQFDGLMQEFHDLDAKAGKAQTTDDNIGTLRDRLEWYTGKATGTPMRFIGTELDPNGRKSMGQQFIESDAYKSLVASGSLGSENARFRTDPVIVGGKGARGFRAAATDVIQTESGGPAAGLVTPYYLPGVQQLPQAPLVVRDLFPNEDMPSGDQLSYAAQVGFDNAAAAVSQATAADGSGASGGVKPQSSIAWERRTAVAEWISTWMATTRQAIADAEGAQMRALIDNQGRLMVAIEEDDQFVNGNGTSPNLSGILDQSALQTLDLTGEDNLDGIRVAKNMVKTGLSRLNATFIIINPDDSVEFDLMKDLEGRYRAGDPFGNGPELPPIWRLQRAESEAVTPGTAIVGSGAGATIFDRQPLTVLTADQHADFFVRNLVVVLFEERVAFPIYFPTAFVEVTLADWAS